MKYMLDPKKYKKLKEIIQKANPEIIQEFEENGSITEQIGCFVRQSTEPTGRKYIYEREIRLADVLLVLENQETLGDYILENEGHGVSP